MGVNATNVLTIRVFWFEGRGKNGKNIQHALNSVYFVSPDIKNYKCSTEGFTVCTHTTPLTFDLTSEQEKLPRNNK